jgi:hypothetical protein
MAEKGAVPAFIVSLFPIAGWIISNPIPDVYPDFLSANGYSLFLKSGGPY